MGRIVSVFSTKGGTGKSLICVNLATVLAQRGQTVLVIDADAQGNTSTTLLGRGDHHPGLAPLLLELVTIKDTVRPSNSAPGVDVIPGGHDLSDTTVALATVLAGRDLRLRNSGVAELGYDWVLIDCPPERSTLTVNALAASDGVIIPVDGSLHGVDGITGAATMAAMIRKALPNPRNPAAPQVDGIVMNRVAKNKTHAELEASLRAAHGGLVLGVIPAGIAADSATFKCMPVVLHSPASPITKEIERIAGRILEGKRNVAA